MNTVDQQEAYNTFKKAIESELKHWRRRHKSLTEQCANLAETLRQLSITQLALQEEMERWPEVLAHVAASSMKKPQGASAAGNLDSQPDSMVHIDTRDIQAEVKRLRKDITKTEERIQTLQKSLQHETSQGVKLALKQQMEIAVRDLEQMREALQETTRDIEETQEANEEAQAAAAALQFLEELSEEEEELNGADRKQVDRPTNNSQSRQPASDQTKTRDVPTDSPLPPTHEMSQESREWEKRIQVVISEHGYQKQLMGYILVKAGFITKPQLEEALQLQFNKPHSHLGEILVEQGVVSPEIIALVLAAQSFAVYVRLKDVDVDPEAVALISERLAYQHTCLPVRATEDSLDLVIANPMDLVAIEDVECATNRRVNVLVATEKDLREALEKYYWEPE